MLILLIPFKQFKINVNVLVLSLNLTVGRVNLKIRSNYLAYLENEFKIYSLKTFSKIFRYFSWKIRQQLFVAV